MFQGETAITIDDKGRLAIPTAYRDIVARECGNRLVVTYNPFESGCLYLYPQPVWERVRDQVNALPRTKKNSRLLQLKVEGRADLHATGLEQRRVAVVLQRLRDQVAKLRRDRLGIRLLSSDDLGQRVAVGIPGLG